MAHAALQYSTWDDATPEDTAEEQQVDDHLATRQRMKKLQILNIHQKIFLIFLLEWVKEASAAPQTLFIALLESSVVIILAQTGH